MSCEKYVKLNMPTYHLVPMLAQPTTLDYAFANSPFGRVLLAATSEGLCAITLVTNKAIDEATALAKLAKQFPKAALKEDKENLPRLAVQLLRQPTKATEPTPTTTLSTLSIIKEPLVLHLKGTPFQLKVWETLLTIPLGETRSYGWVARQLEQPGANRAVGTAVGANPVFYVVPCHRVIRSDGSLGQYYWGAAVKAAILEWERSVVG